MERRILPIGIQSFSKLREKGCLYVDKTGFIYRLASEAGIYFLSRPRRFGKSLLLSAMEAYFSGRKDLFEGLAIERLEEEAPTGEQGAWTPSPVIKLDFNAGSFSTAADLRNMISEKLHSYEQEWGKDPAVTSLAGRFQDLIQTMYHKTGLKVVILVDEYDKPLLENLQNETLNSQMRKGLKAFYGALKSADDYIRFVFLAGVTKFSHVSIFSDLNQLRDISMDTAYNDICGMTLSEIEGVFEPELQALSQSLQESREDTAACLAKKYDGYCFTEKTPGMEGIFNPFSVLNCFAQRKLKDYWFATGTPTFLIEMMKETRFDAREILSGVDAKPSLFTDYRADAATPIPLFYQSGYLTIKAYDRSLGRYRLAVPNDEVKYGLVESFLPVYTGIIAGTGFSVEDFVVAVREGDVDGFMEGLASLIASVPYDESRRGDKLYTYEYTYKLAVFLIFTLAGQYIRSEVHTIKGRSDAVCETDTSVYIFEFKMSDAADGTADAAIRQIEEKGYARPYQASGKEIVEIGLVFDAKERNITEWKQKRAGGAHF